MRVNRDPALLEQVGPRQYRLRVFPIPGSTDRTTLSGRNQKVQYTYSAELTKEGYPLPKFTKALNIKDNSLTYLRQGDDLNRIETGENAKASLSPCDLGTRLSVQMGTFQGVLTPHSISGVSGECADSFANLNEFNDKNIAIMIDVSRKNNDSQDLETLKELLSDNQEFLSQNKVELVEFSDVVAEPKSLDSIEPLNEIYFFGTSDIIAALNSLDQKYDMAIVLTHDENFDIEKVGDGDLINNISLYIVHDSQIPSYPANTAAKIIQDGGGSFTNVKEAFAYALLNSEYSNNSGYPSLYWSYNLSQNTPEEGEANQVVKYGQLNKVDTFSGQSLSFLVAQAYLYKNYQAVGGVIQNQISFLDNTQEYAKNANIITPYSSLIALINQAQLNILNQQADNLDRYDESRIVTNNNIGRVMPPQSLNNTFSSPWGMETTSFDFGSTSSLNAPSGGGGGVGTLSVPVAARNSGIGVISMFVMANLVLFGIGFIVFLVLKLKNIRRKK